MALAFRGTALPLDQSGMDEVLDVLKVKAPELWAVLTVETLGCGFLPDRRPVILFERHIFSRETNHQFDKNHSGISNPKAGGYGAGGAHQYDRLNEAIALNRAAALKSASWGIGQLMGFNASVGGFNSVENMVTEMEASEKQQLLGTANFIVKNKLAKALSTHDWANFARGYNGADFAKNHYDTRLAAAFQKFNQGPLPDLVVRAAQVYLIYLGFHPGPVDGVMGRLTRSALNQFQEDHDIPTTEDIDAGMLARLKQEVGKLPA